MQKTRRFKQKSMQILHLKEYEKNFFNYCKQFYNGNRKKDWFDPNLPYSIVNRYKQYPHWTFLVNNDKNLVAFSSIQTHFFPENCVRVLTRTFYHPTYRRKTLDYETKRTTPAMLMLEDQLKWISDNLVVDHLFFSVEYLRRKSSLMKLAQKLNNKYNMDWKVLDKLYQTYPNNFDKNSWQVVCAHSNSMELFPLKSM